MSETAPRESDVAVVAMSGRFPGARDLREFRRNLWAGVESISFFSEEELERAGVDREVRSRPDYVPARGILDGVEEFDAAFFGYTPREAEVMDPQHRLFLEHAWQAFELAGVDPRRFAGPIGVFAGLSLNAYALGQLSARRPESEEALETHLGNAGHFLPTRVSYKLGLRGPSVQVQSACSSSLVAVHLACQSLLSGECDLALAGGVSLVTPQETGYLYRPASIQSPDGHCRPFDAGAAGTLFSNGLGVVVLQRLDEALAGGFPVRAVVRGTAVNNDGDAKIGFTAPSIDGQAAVVAEAQTVAGVDPDTIGYLEAHGTGTRLGDPVEIAALTRAFRAGTDRRGSCAIGSLKSNVGHLDQAAGIAGLIKTVFALERRQIPPSLHFERSNPEIDLAASPFSVATELKTWSPSGHPRRAGVTALGLGGTNAHAVLEEAPPMPPAGASRRWQLLPLSARTPAGLDAATARLGERLVARPEVDLADAAYTLQVGRAELEHRRMLVCRSRAGAARALTAADPERLRSSSRSQHRLPIVFLFPGAGVQHLDMGRELYHLEPEFRRWLDRCAEGLAPRLGWDLRQVIQPEAAGRESATTRLRRTSVAIAAVFAIEVALARLWMSWGIEPKAMLGFSLGEYAAACLAGVLSLDDALALVALRSRLFERLPAGGMLAMPLPEAEVRPLLAAGLDVAAVNGPESTVVSGDPAALEALADRLAARGLAVRPLALDAAAHSPAVDAILDDFAAGVRGVRLAAPRVPFVSSVTGTWITAEQATDPGYWTRHLRRTVRFGDGLATVLAEESLLLEVGPGRSLGSLVGQQPDAGRARAVLTSLPHPDDPQPEPAWLLTTLGRLWLAGAAVDWQGFHGRERRRRIELPTYPFERRRYWRQVRPRQEKPRMVPGGEQRAAGRLPPEDWLSLPLWRRTPPAALLEPAATGGTWLVFVAGETGEEIVERLRAADRRLLVAAPGDGFRCSGGDRFRLRMGHAQDHDALLEELEARGLRPRRVLHLATLDRDGTDWRDLGLHSLLLLARAWGRRTWEEPVALDVVGRGLYEVTGGEELAPEQATLGAPVRVLPQELSHWRCRLIDLGARDPLKPLLDELAAAAPEAVVALRGGHRWVPSHERVRPQAERGAALLREGGHYLITGGLGGIGLALAERLAMRHARLVLTGRSPFPARDDWPAWLSEHGEADQTGRKIRRIQELEAAGAEVLAASADVARRDVMAAVLSRAANRFGPLHGVIHGAGLLGGGLVVEQTRESLAEVLAPKVEGTRVLESLLATTPLDFFVLCSSRNALRGGVGTVDYCAASAFLDAFAHCNTLHSRTRTVAVGWCDWAEVGMSAREAARDGRPERRGRVELGLRAGEGWDVFLRALGAGARQVTVSTTGLEAPPPAADSVPLAAASARQDDCGAGNPRPSLETLYVAPRDELEERIAGLWQELLGFDRVGAHDDFFELGGHSVLATRVLARLRRREGVELNLPQLFAAPTVAALARAVARAPSAATGDEIEEGAL